MTPCRFFICILLAWSVIWLAAFTGSAGADEVTGLAQLTYSSTRSKTDNGNGNISHQDTNDFFQEYTISFTKLLYPNLKLLVSGLFEQDMSTSRSDTGVINSTTTTIQPLVDLSLGTRMFGAEAYYSKYQITTQSSVSGAQTLISENYNGLLTFKPEGLPSLNLNVQRTEAYDKERIYENTDTDRLLIGSRFTPIKNLDMNYQFEYDDTTDKISSTEVTDLTNSGRVMYSNSFFDNRVSFYGDGNITYQETTTSFGASSTGGAQITQVPLSGLYASDSTADSPVGVDVPPHVPANDAMKSTPFLISGDVISNVGKINIGFPQINPGDNNPRDVGLSFGQPTELNAIYVTVNQDISRIAVSYSWDVYFSNNTAIGQQGLNPLATQQWTLYQQAASFTFSELNKTFQITFPKVTALFFKVVTRPLSVPATVPGVDTNNIFITQLQAFDTTSSSGSPKKTVTATSQNYDLNLRVNILKIPALYYDCTYWYSGGGNTGATLTGKTSQTLYTLSNGLSAAYRFSSVFFGSARIAREDIKETQGTGVDYVYNASLTANTLPTLTQNLVFSRSNQQIAGQPNNSTSIFLTNRAEIYKGVDALLSGGISWATTETNQSSEQSSESTLLNLGLSVTPYTNLSMNYTFSGTNSNQTGGGVPTEQTTTEQQNLSVSYTPFRTVSILGSYGVYTGTNVQPNTIQNYGLNWSPFPDGTLQLNFSYTQNLTSLNSTKNTMILPNLRWNISRSMYMTVSYQDFKSQSIVTNVRQSTHLDTFSATFNVTF